MHKKPTCCAESLRTLLGIPKKYLYRKVALSFSFSPSIITDTFFECFTIANHIYYVNYNESFVVTSKTFFMLKPRLFENFVYKI